MKKKWIVRMAMCFVCVATISSVLIFLNPTEACGCLPAYEEESYTVFAAAQVTLREAVADNHLHYNNVLLQFEEETMDQFIEEINREDMNPYNVWFRVEGDEVTELLYKTERTISYAGIFSREETIYIWMRPDLRSEIYKTRPQGW